MREIFIRRGKRVDNGKWVYGNIVFTRSGRAFLLEGSFFSGESHEGDFKHGEIYGTEVIPATVGQFTGLLDKNGNKIFEGDIVHAVYQSNYVGCKNIDFGIGVVKYCDSYYGGASYQIDIIDEIGSRVFTYFLKSGVEVIGNVHDNPELLNKGEQLCFFLSCQDCKYCRRCYESDRNYICTSFRKAETVGKMLKVSKIRAKMYIEEERNDGKRVS